MRPDLVRRFMNDSLRRVFATDSGMVAVWQPDQFHGIVDYDTWERELLEDADIFQSLDRLSAHFSRNRRFNSSIEIVLRVPFL